MPNILVSFGKRVRKLREARGLSQEALAERCEIEGGATFHANYIGRIELGKQNISLINIEKLARGLRVKPGDLFKGIR